MIEYVVPVSFRALALMLREMAEEAESELHADWFVRAAEMCEAQG